MITWIDKDNYFGESPQHSLLIFYDDDPLSGGAEQFRLLDQTMLGSASIDYASTALNALEIGTTIATQFDCSVFYDDIPTGTRLGGMWVWVYSCISYNEPINLNEWNSHGVYWIDGNPKYKNVITITGLDHFIKMDDEIPLATFKRWAGSGKTPSQYFGYVCTQCGVTGVYTASANDGLVIVPPEEQGMTYRQLLGWLFGVMGVIGYIDDGVLKCKYPTRQKKLAIVGQAIVGQAVVGRTTNSTQPYDITFTMRDRFSSEYEDDISISGITVTDYEGNVNVYGKTGHTYDMSYNPMITDRSLVNTLSVVKPLTYAPMSMETVPCPWIVPNDWVRYEDKDGNYHYGVVTNATHCINGHSHIECRGTI